MNDSIQNRPNQRSTGGRNERRDDGKKNNTANRPGKLHGNADSLSRAPKHCKQCHVDHVNICVAKMEDEVVLSKPLRCLQDEDKDITTVKELLVHNTKCTKDVAAQSLTVKSLCSQLDRLVI